MKELENLLRERKLKKFRLGLTEADQKWEPTMVVSDPRKQIYRKSGEVSEMMPEEREDYEAEQEAERIQRQILDEEERKKRNQR